MLGAKVNADVINILYVRIILRYKLNKPKKKVLAILKSHAKKKEDSYFIHLKTQDILDITIKRACPTAAVYIIIIVLV